MRAPGNPAVDRVRRFHLLCTVISLLWLLVVPPVSLIWRPNLLDFPQFYMGGAIVRERAFEALYPIPRPGSAVNPGFAWESQMRPPYAALAERLGVGDGMRFIQPPPVALLLWPMSLLPYPAAGRLWVVLLGLAAWGAALVAARILTLLLGRRSYAEGALILAVACSPRTLATIRWGNVSTLVALCLAVLTLDILRDRRARGGVALLLGAVVKYAPAALVPLALAARRFRMFLWSAGCGLLLLGLSLAIMGWDPYRVYLREILPTLGRPFLGEHNQSLHAALSRWTGGAPLSFGSRAVLATLQLLVLGWILRRFQVCPRSHWERPLPVFAAAACLVSWFLVFSPVFWSSYHIYLWPFWGWVLWEWFAASHCGAGARVLTRAAVVLVFLLGWFPWPPIAWLLFHRKAIEPFASSTLFSAILMLALGLRRMAGANGDQGSSSKQTRLRPDALVR